MLAVGLAIFNSLYSTQSLLPVLSEDFGVTPAVAALTVSAATGALAVFIVPLSILSEKFGRGPVLVASALGATLLGLALPLAQTATQLITLRTVQGALIAGAPAVAMTWLSEELDGDDLPGAMGMYIAGTTIGGLTGRLIPSAMLEFTSWHIALLTTAAFALVLAVTTAVILPAQRNFTPKASIRPAVEARAALAHLRNPRLLGLYATAFIGMGVFVSMYNYFSYRAMDFFGLPPSLMGLIFLMYLSGTWSSARAGALVSRFGRGQVVLGGAVLMLAGTAATASSSLPLVLAGLFVFTASFFAMHSTASGWVGQLAQRDRAEASSLYLFAYYMGSSILGAATGAAYGALPWWGFITVLIALLAALVAAAAALAVVSR